jgi:hypothetical protein
MLQWLGRTCAPNEAKNPETGTCYKVCEEGQKYDPATGCGDLNWFKEHGVFLAFVGAATAYAWWRFL